MAIPRIQNEFPVFTLTSPNGPAQAEVVPQLGGIVSSLILPESNGPRECLYRHDHFWDPLTDETRGGIPLLFPVCGRLLKDDTPGRYEVNGQAFTLPIHGFAMRLPWKVVDASRSDELRLRLTDTPETRKIYPFAFELELHYRVSGEGLTCRLTVTNTGTQPMPYAAGFHPYLATLPASEGKEAATFSAKARSRLLYNETKTDVRGTAPPPDFPKPVTDEDINSLLLDVGTWGHTTLHFPDGDTLHLSATGEEDPGLFRYRQFYTLPNEPFFCDEPWTAPSNALNDPEAARHLPPGKSESGRLHISLSQC